MASLQDIVRGPAARMAAALAASLLVMRLLDAPPGSAAELGGLAARAWMVVLLRPLGVALGLAAALYLARTRVRPERMRAGRRMAAAFTVVLTACLAGSMVFQPAGAASGLVFDVVVGAGAALLAYPAWRHPAGIRRAAT